MKREEYVDNLLYKLIGYLEKISSTFKGYFTENFCIFTVILNMNRDLYSDPWS